SLCQMLDVLPSELLTSILGHTTKQDKLSTSMVCRRVQSVICSTRSLKKRPDEIVISSRLVHPVTYQLGRLRMGKEKMERGKRRLVVTLKRNQRDEKRRETVIDTMEADEIDDSLPSTSSNLSQLEDILAQCIHGHTLLLSAVPINIALLDLLSSSSTELNRVSIVNLELCVFADEEGLLESLRSFLSKTSVRLLILEFCREEGEKKIICDELFDGLTHLQSISLQERLPGANGISKDLVENWLSSASAPYRIDFPNVESSISLESVMRLIEFAARTPRPFKTVWNLGTIRNTDKGALASLLLLAEPELSIAIHIDMVGQRHIKITHPFLDVVFTTIGC
ncbi:hypothetical protein PENTCL1PPCAC_1156, partial [Pristionchus entomophagus]